LAYISSKSRGKQRESYGGGDDEQSTSIDIQGRIWTEYYTH